jgi:hypothetical protein
LLARLRTGPGVVGAFLALGGAWGIISAIWQRSSANTSGGVAIDIEVPPLALVTFGLVAAAGVLLFKGAYRSRLLATIVLALQLVSFQVNGFAYYFRTGASVGAGVELGGPGIGIMRSAHLGSNFTAARSSGPDSFVVNGVAVACLIALWYRRRSPGAGVEESQAPAPAA